MLRDSKLQRITAAFKVHPIVGLLGPRQSGKTTLAHQFITTYHKSLPTSNFFDLEDHEDRNRLTDPKLALTPLQGLIVIDEIQKAPHLFETLRVLVDHALLGKRAPQQYLILGSASRDLIKQSSETLAGRIGYLELTPFDYLETKQLETLWLRGGFPKSYLAETDEQSMQWRQSYIRTYLERDIPQLGFNIPAENINRFWMMLAHYHGQVVNYSDLASSLGLTSKTVRNYSDLLAGTFMVRQLRPWYTNIAKRQVKSHKIYFRDSGILHTFLRLADKNSLLTHPRLGASWEGFAIEEIIRHYNASEECYFWATHANAELDLLILHNGKKLGFEFKYSLTPKVTKSMLIAMHDLQLDKLTIVYPGDKQYYLKDNIEVVGLEILLNNCTN